MMLLSRFQSVTVGLSRLFRGLLETGAVKGVAVSALLTGLAAIASLGMLTALARSMPEADFGVLVGWMNTLLFLSVVAIFGQETMFVRSWHEFVHAGRLDLARGILLFGAGISLLGWVVVSLAVTASSWWLGLGPELTIGLVVFLFAQTFCLFSSQTARITAGITAGVVHRELTWRCVVLLSLAWFASTEAAFTPLLFFYAAAGGILLASLLLARSTVSAVPQQVFSSPTGIDAPGWLRRSSRMWLAALLEAASQYLDVAIIAILLSPRDAAIYFVCQKLAAIFLMLGDAFGLYSSRQISFLYYRSDLQSLRAMLKQLSLLMLPLCMLGLLVVTVGGSDLLQIFGAAYGNHGTILMILSIGTAAAALGGPVTHVLLLTGHETAYIRTLAAATFLRYAGIVGLGWFSGLAGAAVANASAMLLLTVALILLCRRFVGVDPSALALVAGHGMKAPLGTPHFPQTAE